MSRINLAFRNKKYSINKSILMGAVSKLTAAFDRISEGIVCLEHTYENCVCTNCGHTLPYDMTSPGLHQGNVLVKSWDELLAEKIISVEYNTAQYQKALNIHNNTALKGDLIIPDDGSVDSIYNMSNCTKLTAIVVPSTVEKINRAAFAGCSSLESMTLPFVGCSSGTYDSSNLFGSIFGQSSTEGMVNTHQYYYDPSDDSEIDYDYYLPANLHTVIITGGKINTPAFVNCSMLVTVNLADTVTFNTDDDRCYSVFRDCTALTKVKLPNSMPYINMLMFSYCSSLADIVIPNNVTTISTSAFQGCDNINVVIPSNVTTIKSSAFSGCNSLTSAVIPDSVTSIGNQAFNSCANLAEVVISQSVTSIGAEAFANCSALTNLVVSDDNQQYSSLDGNLYDKARTQLIQYAIGKTATYFEIPNSVTSIGAKALQGCESLINITIPDNLTTIGSYAFSSCANLVSIIIPTRVTKIGFQAFWGCNNLTIFCKATSKPTGWDYYWNTADRPVVWGYSGEEFNYNFVTNSNEVVEPVTSALNISLPTLSQKGYYFLGWYDNSEFTGNLYTTSYYSTTNHTLYAYWLTEEEYLAKYMGTSFDLAYSINLEEALPVVIDTPGKQLYFKFIAPTSNSYTFTASEGSCDSYGTLYDANQLKLSQDDDSAGNRHFKLIRSLTENQVVYIVARLYSSTATGTYSLTVTA